MPPKIKMSDDWDTVTKIGSKARASGGGERETTIKSKSALNAAQRSGAVIGTEKKFSSANVSGPSNIGQTVVDKTDNVLLRRAATLKASA